MAALKVPAMSAQAWAVLAAVVLVGGYVWYRGIGGAAKDAARGLVDAAAGVGAGTVIGIGDAVGVPATSQNQCQADLAAGRTWDASFSCPAGTFLGSLFNSPSQVDQSVSQ